MALLKRPPKGDIIVWAPYSWETGPVTVQGQCVYTVYAGGNMGRWDRATAGSAWFSGRHATTRTKPLTIIRKNTQEEALALAETLAFEAKLPFGGRHGKN